MTSLKLLRVLCYCFIVTFQSHAGDVLRAGGVWDRVGRLICHTIKAHYSMVLLE